MQKKKKNTKRNAAEKDNFLSKSKAHTRYFPLLCFKFQKIACATAKAIKQNKVYNMY